MDRPFRIYPILAIVFILLGQVVFANDQLNIITESHSYTIHSQDSYDAKMEIEGINLSTSKEYFSLPVNELAELTELSVLQWDKKKWKQSKIKDDLTISNMSWGSFFTGTKNYIFSIPPGVKFKIIFATKEKHSIFISKMFRDGYFDAESTNYTFQIPTGFALTTRSMGTFKTSAVFQQSDFDSLEVMPLIIHPENEQPKDYFSNWFKERIDPQLEISGELIPKELKEIHALGDRRALAEACFRFVQRKIKYIDIENGINAIIPRQCEKVLNRGLGDCKDMATLLTALYRHFRFEAYPAISRTNSKTEPFNFPAVGLANHTICALRFEDEWYFLDATEDICLFGDPSIQIMGTEVFLVGRSEGYFVNVPAETRSHSIGRLHYSIDEENESISMHIQATGKMNGYFNLLRLKSAETRKDLNKSIDKITEMEWTLDSLDISDTLSDIHLSTPLQSTMYSTLSGKRIYNLAFLPEPQLVLALFQNSVYPIFKSEVQIDLKFSGNISGLKTPENSTEFTSSSDGKTLKIACKFEQFPSRESFEEGELVENWNTILTQPIIINYEK